MRKFLFLPLLCLLCYFPLTYFLADRFTPSHIASSRQFAESSIPVTQEVLAALSQKYHYLGSGSQTYAFVSEDARYVIKFFKHQRYRIASWLTALPLPAHLKEIYQRKALQKEEKLQNHLTSCRLAFQELQEETALLYLHLGKEPLLNKRVVFEDKLHRSFTLALDNYDFQLQRKVKPLPPTQEGFEAAVALLERVFEKGIAQTDCAFQKNIGMSGSQAVFIDTGSFAKDSRLKDQFVRKEEIRKALLKCRS